MTEQEPNPLRRLRERAGLSQQQLADLASTSQPQIRRLEAGERALTTEWAIRLAPHLHCKIRDLAPVSLDALMADHPEIKEQVSDYAEYLLSRTPQ